MNNKFFPIITIDGPSASGKGTLSKNLAQILGWNLLDSGVLYRALALITLNDRIRIENEQEIVAVLNSIKIQFVNKYDQFYTLLNGKKINKNIYTESVGVCASKIAVLPKVRNALLEYQRTFLKFPGLIADGRDMGTVVFPNAVLKVFLYASLKERYNRRLNQLYINNIPCRNIIYTIKERDERDQNRKIAPLTLPSNALILDSTYLSAEATRNIVFMYLKENIVLSKDILYNHSIHY